MALIFTDPNAAGPFATFQDNQVSVRVVRLQAAQFTTAGVNTLALVLPGNASILSIDTWVATALDNGATAPLLSVGSASGGTQFANAVAITNTVGTAAKLSPVAGIMQAYQVPVTGDIQVWLRGICSTANPTNADVRVAITYCR